MAISKKQRVTFRKANGSISVGFVTEFSSQDVRLVDIDKHQYTTNKNGNGAVVERESIKPIEFGIRVFDSVLENKKGDTSSRNAANYWGAVCRASGWRFNYERIHSITDLEYFFTSFDIPEPVIIFSGHGDDSISPGFLLTNNEVFSGAAFQKNVRSKNRGKIIIFSSCLVGNKPKICDDIKQLLSAQAVLAYSQVVHDHVCFLIESHFLTLIYRDSSSTRLRDAYAVTVAETDSIRAENRFLLRVAELQKEPQAQGTVKNTHPLKLYI